MERSCWLMVVYLSIYSRKSLSVPGQVAFAEWFLILLVILLWDVSWALGAKGF